MGVDPSPDHSFELVRLPDNKDASEVVYALKMRQIEATATRLPVPEHGLRWAVMTAPHNADTARAHLPYILDVMLPSRAEDGRGGCYHCGYSLEGIPNTTPRCPECGGALRTLEARFRARQPR